MLRTAPLLLTSLILLNGCKDDVTIRYTEFNVPHITSGSHKGLGYGVGYVHAEENLCTLAEQIMKLKSEKSRYLGPGTDQANILSDLGYKALDFPAQAVLFFPELEQDPQDLLAGYAAGYNQRLSELTPATYPTPCRDAQWVQPISATDVLAYHLDLAALASSRNLLSPMAVAQPPQATGEMRVLPQLDAEQVFTSKGLGSNGWALGHEKTQGAISSLLANPHFPWDGELRFFQQHLTIPGELDVTGVSFIGLPVVLIGFNKHLGWTHTVSQSKRFTFYQLELDPQNPLRYRYGTEYRDMTARNVTIEVKMPDGSLVPLEKTLYSSHYGPMLELGMLSPALSWNAASAVTFRDANAGNYRMLQQWLALGKSTSKHQFYQALEQHQGIPWVNTLLSDDQGNAHYIDASQVPQLHPVAETYWARASQSPELSPIWQSGDGSVLLPGSEPVFEWVDSGNTVTPGLVPLQQAPQLSRADYLFNANSSHWLGNLEQPLEGFSLMYGPERSIRSPRSRYNAQLISSDRIAGDDNRFSRDELKQVFNYNGSLFADEFREQLVARCSQFPQLEVDNQTVDLAPACSALAQWDGRYNKHSRGAHIMREFLAAFRVPDHRELADTLFAQPFSAEYPATTPGQLAQLTALPEQDPILLALAAAVKRLAEANITPDATLASIQYLLKAQDSGPIAMAGGYSYEGAFNMAEGGAKSRSSSELANNITGAARPDSPLLAHTVDGQERHGYTLNSGSSFVMALQFTPAGPRAEMLHAYSQSHDPASPHFVDQTLKFSEQHWQPVRFTEQDVKTHTIRLLKLRP
ncbi:penicillin acylase family protein [Rheinheimera sp.]|uniref:penicillin acylase family protein n=1 Tax=Rheinheimera sp. TaxID=1869214 RepID=UPI0027357DA1|nr:penicillin acylase family protein [Rheinheimera sp.]MDP2714244.1 penicillin acylase family protein [Rheinheimera sp.]